MFGGKKSNISLYLDALKISMIHSRYKLSRSKRNTQYLYKLWWDFMKSDVRLLYSVPGEVVYLTKTSSTSSRISLILTSGKD